MLAPKVRFYKEKGDKIYPRTKRAIGHGRVAVVRVGNYFNGELKVFPSFKEALKWGRSYFRCFGNRFGFIELDEGKSLDFETLRLRLIEPYARNW